MSHDPYLSPADTAAELGVSAKALRLWEERGLIRPLRTAAGWRAYGADQRARAAEIASLRSLGLSLAQVAAVLDAAPGAMAEALDGHAATLHERIGGLTAALGTVRAMQADLARGAVPAAQEITRLGQAPMPVAARFALPWPWGGETFELRGPRPLTWIVGSLGSGKTCLARALAEHLSGAAFLGLDRPPLGSPATELAPALDWLVGDGAMPSPALKCLLSAMLSGQGPLVVDMVEDGLDAATQQALAAWLRRRGAGARPLLLMTRSTAMLDLDAATADEAILFCPANHAPPRLVAPWPGAAGREALADCLASPEVRDRVAAARQPVGVGS